MRKILIDIDSSSVKVYELLAEEKKLILEKKIFFEDNYRPERGLSFNDEEALVRLLERVSVNFLNCKIEAQAKGIFLTIESKYLNELVSEIKKRARVDLMLPNSN